MGVKNRRDATDRLTHQLQPGERKFSVRFGVIEWDDLVLEQLVKTGSVHLILEFAVAVFDLGADRPAILAVIAFTPPAIEHAQVEAAVWWKLHPARATGFERTQRVVQPKIDPLDQTARNVSVIIFDKDDPVMKAGFASQLVDLLNECFAAFVARMRFSGEDELHRPRQIIQHPQEPIRITKKKRAAFVSGKAPGKTDRQDLRVEDGINRADRFR